MVNINNHMEPGAMGIVTLLPPRSPRADSYFREGKKKEKCFCRHGSFRCPPMRLPAYLCSSTNVIPGCTALHCTACMHATKGKKKKQREEKKQSGHEGIPRPITPSHSHLSHAGNATRQVGLLSPAGQALAHGGKAQGDCKARFCSAPPRCGPAGPRSRDRTGPHQTGVECIRGYEFARLYA